MFQNYLSQYPAKKLLLYLLISLSVAAFFVFLIWRFSQTSKTSPTAQETTQKKEIEEPKVFTQKEIEDALSQPAPDPSSVKPFTETEVKKALEQKAPKDEKSAGFSPAEIQAALNKKN